MFSSTFKVVSEILVSKVVSAFSLCTFDSDAHSHRLKHLGGWRLFESLHEVLARLSRLGYAGIDSHSPQEGDPTVLCKGLPAALGKYVGRLLTVGTRVPAHVLQNA